MKNRYVENTRTNLIQFLQFLKRKAYNTKAHQEGAVLFGDKKVEVLVDVVPEKSQGYMVVTSLIKDGDLFIEKSDKRVIEAISDFFNEDNVFVSF